MEKRGNTKKRPIRKGKKETARKDKKMRDNLREPQIDKMVRDSFPASDPPSTY